MEGLRAWVLDNKTLLVFIGIIVFAFVTLRTQATAIPGDELSSVLGNGKPVVLELYSNT